MSTIWIIAETAEWAASLVSGAQSLGATTITVFVRGDEAAAGATLAFGANAAFALPLGATAMWEDYTPVLAQKARTESPRLIMLSASKRCRDMAAQMAALLDAPCVSDARNINISVDAFSAETMVYGGAAVKTVTTTAPLVIVTVGAQTYEATTPDASCQGAVATLAPATARGTVTERKPRAAQTVNLGEATKVVGIGRGISDQADLATIKELAEKLGGEMACSRPIAEFFKWMPEECYIGISGQVIKPQLYLAIGISGQAQHYYGVREAKVIVSINKDAEALMNQNADYSIVGDWKEVVPALMKAL